MLISPCKSGVIDAPIYRFLKDIKTDIPIVPVTRIENYVFNEELLKLDKYVIIDYSEYFWNWNRQQTHIFGENTFLFENVFSGDEWNKFDNFVLNNPPKLYFKRELLQKDVTDKVLPIEYPCFADAQPIETRDEFNARKIDILHYWGHSHESRRIFQGNAYLHAVREDITIIDNIYYAEAFLNENHKRYWATMHIPHFARLPIENILHINGMSKLSLSLPGAGVKCFRHSESPVNSIMALWWDELAWSYKWEHAVNCIRINEYCEIEDIEFTLQRDDLYDIYLKGLETIDKYRVDNYINNYILKEINERF